MLKENYPEVFTCRDYINKRKMIREQNNIDFKNYHHREELGIPNMPCPKVPEMLYLLPDSIESIKKWKIRSFWGEDVNNETVFLLVHHVEELPKGKRYYYTLNPQLESIFAAYKHYVETVAHFLNKQEG